MTTDRTRPRLRQDVEDMIKPLAKGAQMTVSDYVNGLLRIALYNGMRPGRAYSVKDATPEPKGAVTVNRYVPEALLGED